MKNLMINKEAVLNTLEEMDKILDIERTVENYKGLLIECINALPVSNVSVLTQKAYEDGKKDGAADICVKTLTAKLEEKQRISDLVAKWHGEHDGKDIPCQTIINWTEELDC